MPIVASGFRFDDDSSELPASATRLPRRVQKDIALWFNRWDGKDSAGLVGDGFGFFWPIATLPQEFMSAMPAKADKPEPT
jgi:hypothetical protein